MNISILLDMQFDFLSKRKISASYLAEKYGISQRTVYRYVEILSKKIPLVVKRGRNGGICLSDNYRLPVGFMSAEEYTAAVEALSAAYASNPEPKIERASQSGKANTCRYGRSRRIFRRNRTRLSHGKNTDFKRVYSRGNFGGNSTSCA